MIDDAATLAALSLMLVVILAALPSHTMLVMLAVLLTALPGCMATPEPTPSFAKRAFLATNMSAQDSQNSSVMYLHRLHMAAKIHNSRSKSQAPLKRFQEVQSVYQVR